MDRIERVITLLQAAVSGGDVALALRDQIVAAGRSIESSVALADQVSANAEVFVDGSVAIATATILESGGDLSTIGIVLGDAYIAGLRAGLSVGIAAHAD